MGTQLLAPGQLRHPQPGPPGHLQRPGRPQRGAADARLQIREALAGLSSPDLGAQSVFACEALLQEADAGVLDFFLRRVLKLGSDCPSGSARRQRYRWVFGAAAARRLPPPAGTLRSQHPHLRCLLQAGCTGPALACRLCRLGIQQ